MPHIVLLGDSVFDNRAYLAGGPDVRTLLQHRLPTDWKASLCAVDGSTAEDVLPQLQRIPAGATHLILSVGGNDALMHERILYAQVASSAEALLLIAEAVDQFEVSYRATVQGVLAARLPTVVCTVYNANFAEPTQARCIRVAVALFNDVILRVARETALQSIDLRSVCVEPGDYANDIEPSVAGGDKIAIAIMRSLGLA